MPDEKKTVDDGHEERGAGLGGIRQTIDGGRVIQTYERDARNDSAVEETCCRKTLKASVSVREHW